MRLGWTVVPKSLRYADGSLIWNDWNRLVTTVFNGASYISQQGGLAALSPQGRHECQAILSRYLHNAATLKKTFEELGYTTYGGVHSPYLWIHFPGRSSWEVFDQLLEQMHIVTVPGAGFGTAGEGFVRVSAFATQEAVQRATCKLQTFS